MVFRRFSLQIAVRIALLFAALTALAGLLTATDFIIAPALLAFVCIVQIAEIIFFVRRTNRELTRFLEAVRHADFSQSFVMGFQGTGFSELGETLTGLMSRFRDYRAEQEREIRYLRSVVEHVPVPLLSLGSGGRVTLLNTAARRFFAPASVTRLADLDAFGPALRSALENMTPGDRRLIRLAASDGPPRRVAMSLTEIIVGTDTQRLVALQNISTELDATELEAWQQLVHVLTHEIMNSLTPVSSLAETAAGLLRDGGRDPEALADVELAVETVAQRAGALMEFVRGYRRITRLPPPKRRPVRVAGLFDRLKALTAAEFAEAAITLETEVTPGRLEIRVDNDQLEQVLINLLQNATEALEGRDDGRIRLTGRVNRDGRAVIEVGDNGPGIAADAGDRIFVPFFTTKRGGSGIGLALTRQVMIAHRGAVLAGQSAAGGALITLVF